MADKPQTLAEQIRALEPPRGMGPASIMRSGWNEAIKEAAALADLTAWRDGQRPPTEYEQKLAAMKKDFPNGI